MPLGRAVPADQECLTVSAVAKPGDHVLGVRVRREDRVEHFLDFSVARDEGEALHQRHAFHLERRQLQRLHERELLIAEHFDLRPAAILRDLDLLRPIYAKTAAYGHFGRDDHDFTWERTDKAEALRAAAGVEATTA